MTRLSPGLRYIVHDVMILNEFLLFYIIAKESKTKLSPEYQGVEYQGVRCIVHDVMILNEILYFIVLRKRVRV